MNSVISIVAHKHEAVVNKKEDEIGPLENRSPYFR